VPQKTAFETIKMQQLAWAGAVGVSPDPHGYCANVEQNVFRALSPFATSELLAGDGGELGENGKRCKAQALHSSAILACNFFDYWRGRDLSMLATVFGTGELCGMRFEAKFPTGLRGTSPNIDVVLYEWSGAILAIESKFTEPCHASSTKGYLKPKYFDTPDMWARVGLKGCQALANELRENPGQFKVLDAAQLLKHMLGLATNTQAHDETCASGHLSAARSKAISRRARTKHKNWRLCCLWYRAGGPQGDLHAAELDRFIEQIGSDKARFAALTYQEAFGQLHALLGPEHSAYQQYLRSRYFATSV
jgi:hypothetical protein